jgi:hypothetical protein
MMSDVNSLKTLSALATDAAGSGDFVPTSGGTFTGQITVNKSGFSSVTISNDSTSESQLRFDTSTAARISNQSETALIFDTNASERMRIDSSGNLGIGVTSPTAKLHVDAPNTTTPSLTFAASAGQIFQNEDSELAIGLSASSPYPLYMQGRTNANAARDISLQPVDGNVGIGVTSPSQKLEVLGNAMLKGVSTEARFLEIGSSRAGDGNSYLDFVSDTTYSDYGLRIVRLGGSGGANAPSQIIHRGTSTLSLTAVEAGKVTFVTNNTERMRVDQDGNVDVGNQSAVNGGRYLDITNTNGVATNFSILRLITQEVGSSSTTSADLYKRKNGQLTLSNNDTDSAAYLSFQVGASERMRIASTGDITFKQGVVNLESASGNPAQMNFYCESGNAHYTRLQSSPHASYSGNVVLTLPTTSGTLATTATVATTGKAIAMAIVFG